MRSQPSLPATAPAGPVPLLSFMKALFTDAVYKRVLECKPRHGHGQRFEDAFRHAYVRFTHFAKLDDPVTSFLAVIAITRGMAFQCSISHEGLDIMIPFVLGIEGRSGTVTPLSKEHVSAIFVSVKDRVQKTTISVDTGLYDFFPKPRAHPNDVRPYIALSMELGVKAEAPELPVKILRRTRSEDTPPQHPCYVIKTFGCHENTFRVVQHEARWVHLLGTGCLLNEHPRQNKDILDVLRRMKLFWKQTGEPWFDWNELHKDSELYHCAVESSVNEIQPNSPPLDEGTLWGN
jgi:hypothetical protein